MRVHSEWIKDVETGIQKMWTKLKEYYSDGKPFAYSDAIILHPSEKMHWFKKRGWDSALIDQYCQSTKARFEKEYAVENRKRSFSTMESDDSDSEEEHSEFESYMGHKKQKGVGNPLIWWKSSQGMFPKLAQMARDTYAVPATSSGVEREFSISGNIVSNRRNRLSPKTISDIMQYKRWMVRTGVVAEFLKDKERSAMETEVENETELDDADDDELNEDLIAWLEEWEKAQSLTERAQALEPVA
jgi:hAT family C-terminal dimerisation region